VAESSAWLAREQPDLVVVTGDFTAFGEPGEFERASRWLASIDGARLAVPGNHDTPYVGILQRLTRPFARYEQALGPADGTAWTSPDLAVAGVNTARGVQLRLNWSKGAIDASQTQRALDQLGARPAGALSVIACHHPLVEMIGGPMTARVRGGERAARRFCEAGVDLILTGHIHAPFAMALPHGDAFTYAVGASTLSIRERGVPAGFNLIEADEAQVKVTAMAWTDGGLDTWRTWSFPRRRASPAPGV
jgi:3',5'-cyclic AMP phosphodiesterase CpdA